MRLLLLMVLPLTAQIPEATGRLVDEGGRKVHIHCTGSGSPTVVLEAGASSFSLDWSLVQPEIARNNRVCSYDRSRLGWSDAGLPETASNFVQDLHRVLAAVNEKGPYVMVGASMGGIYVRLFQLRYPREVVGMVLVDPSDELRLYTRFEGKTVPIASLSADQYRTVMPKTDVKIPRRTAHAGEPFSRLPDALFKTRVLLDQRTIDSYPPSVSAAVVAEHGEAERAVFAELREARGKGLGNLPLVILSRGSDTDKERIASFDAMAAMSARSRHTVVTGAGHEIHLYEPAAVVAAIREVVGMAGSK